MAEVGGAGLTCVPVDLRDHLLLAVGLVDAERVLDEVDDREIRDVAAVRDASSDDPGGIVVLAALACLVEEPRLAHAGVTAHEEHRPVT